MGRFSIMMTLNDVEFYYKSDAIGLIKIRLDLAPQCSKNRFLHVKLHVFSKFRPLPGLGEKFKPNFLNLRPRKHLSTSKSE